MNSPLRSLILEARIYTAAQQREVDDDIRKKREKEQKRMLRERSKERADFSAKSLEAFLNNNDDDDDDDEIVAVPTASQEKIVSIDDKKKNENDDDNNNGDENIQDKKLTTEQQEQNASDDARDTAVQNSGKFTCFPICVKKSEICYSLLDSEEKVASCMAKLMPVLDTLIARFNNTMNKDETKKQKNTSTTVANHGQEANTANYAYHLSWDCEWHQNEGENFSSPNTKLSLIQVGIAEAPLHTDSPILVLVFDLLKLKDATTTAALKQIFESPTRAKSTIQFAFDCRRDAKVMQRYNINLDHVFDLQLLERASRIETVPTPMQHNYVFRLSGLHKIMTQYRNQFEFFLDLKSGINADESEAHFLARPLTRETLLYSAVDAAVLFLVFIAFDRDLGADRMKHLAAEVFDSSQRYAEFESLADDVKMNEHGLLPLKIIPRLDGIRAGNERCSICKRDVAVRAEVPCTVCRKRDIDLKRNNHQMASSSSSPTYSNHSASPTVSAGSPYAGNKNDFVRKNYNNKNSLPPPPPPKIEIPNDVLKSLLSQHQQQQQPQNNYRQNNVNYSRNNNNYNNNNNTASSGPYVTLPSFPNQFNNNNNSNFNLQALPAHQQVLMMMSAPPVPQPQLNNNNNTNNNYYNNNQQQNNTNSNNWWNQSGPVNNNNNTNQQHQQTNNNWGQTWNQNVPVKNGNGFNNNNNYYQQQQQPSTNSWTPVDYSNNGQRGRGRGNNNNNNFRGGN